MLLLLGLVLIHHLVGRTDTVSHATGGTRGTDAQVGAWKLDPSFEGYDLVLSVVGVVGRNVIGMLPLVWCDLHQKVCSCN